MISSKSVANAVGGKTARACDSCVKKRARWYCAADDAFLCQACDSSVHSANPLARRHERVRLKTSSLKNLDLGGSKENTVPTWHRGFTRKARTPRHGKPRGTPQSKTEETIRNPIPLVPEVGSDDVSHEDDEEQHLLYRVPVFDPFVAELCTTSTTISNEAGGATVHSSYGGDGTDRTAVDGSGLESKPSTLLGGGGQGQDVESLHSNFLPSDMDLADFAADVESLLGKGLENESFGMEELGLFDCDNKEEKKFQMKQCVKVEEELGEEAVGPESHGDIEIDMGRDPPFELTFDYDSPATCGEDLKNSSGEPEDDDEDGEQKKKKKKRKVLLTLNYEAVMTAWASQGSSPWTNGRRPDFDPDECWPDCMGSCGTQFHPYADMSGVGGHHAMMDVGREARVSRYREKRRTRLFSKKIRYEVRKLNAEKRPRMKGRFVKRANFAGPAAAFLQSAK